MENVPAAAAYLGGRQGKRTKHPHTHGPHRSDVVTPQGPPWEPDEPPRPPFEVEVPPMPDDDEEPGPA